MQIQLQLQHMSNYSILTMNWAAARPYTERLDFHRNRISRHGMSSEVNDDLSNKYLKALLKDLCSILSSSVLVLMKITMLKCLPKDLFYNLEHRLISFFSIKRTNEITLNL
jgi:hypothetical protein